MVSSCSSNVVCGVVVGIGGEGVVSDWWLCVICEFGGGYCVVRGSSVFRSVSEVIE